MFKYTKYTFAYCRPLIADMLLMGGAIRQHCASCHVTAISYVYIMRKTSSFFRMSYCLNTLIFGNISSASRSVDSVLVVQQCTLTTDHGNVHWRDTAHWRDTP